MAVSKKSAGNKGLIDDQWRSEGRYAGLAQLPPEDLAWEFLRRNPEYQSDYAQIQREEASAKGPGAARARLARWGLTFRSRSAATRQRTTHLLAP